MDFRTWLAGELDRLGISQRELARRLAADYPGNGEDAEADAQRTTLRRILNGKTKNPTKRTRDSIIKALGPDVSTPPAESDVADEPITRDDVAEFRRLALKFDRHFSRSERATPARAQRTAAV